MVCGLLELRIYDRDTQNKKRREKHDIIVFREINQIQGIGDFTKMYSSF